MNSSSNSSSSQMMDKQILGGDGLFDDLMSNKKDDIIPSYDFHPIRTSSSLDSSVPTIFTNASVLEPQNFITKTSREPQDFITKASREPQDFITKVSREPQDLITKVSHEKEKIIFDASTVAEIDRTVKKHVDTLLHALEGVSSRISLLESKTHNIESSVDELRLAIGSYSGSTDGKIRQFENILREVQTGVQVLRDKQEIMEAQVQLAKSQAPKVEQHQPDHSSTVQSEPQQHQVPLPQQPIQHPYQAQVTSQPNTLPALPAPNAPPPPAPPQIVPHFPAQPQHQPSVPSLPRETYFQPPAQVPEVPHQQYQVPVQQPQLPPQRPQQHYQSPPQLPQYPQSNPSQQPVNPSPQLQPPIPQHPEESVPYGSPSQTYPPGIRPPAPPMQSFGPPPQQFYGPNSNMYEPPPSKPGPGQPPFSSGYGQPMGPGFPDAYPYSGSPTRHSSNPGMKQMPFASSVPASGSSSNYPQLPKAQLLPQATSSGSASGGSSGRLPIDDVVEKVSTMGFSREQVRATVRKLTENGQSVDLNVVLDKLMNDGETIQPQKGWFGR